MEPKDIDNIIKNKILESNDLHKYEMDSAKPFVWSAIQNKIRRKRSLTWYHLAVAITILMISFTFVLYGVQKKYTNEMSLLSDKIDQLQKNHVSQAKLLKLKNREVESLGDKLMQVKHKFTGLLQQKPIAQKETFVYRTDTVYLKQVEYITAISTPIESKEITADALVNMTDQTETVKIQEVDDIIFPSYSGQGNRQQAETIKFKFGPLSASRE